MKLFAKVIAVVLHPIFIPIYLFLLFTEAEPVMSLVFAGAAKWRFGFSLLVTMVIGPLMSIYLMKKRGMIDSITMPTLKGRSLSYGITTVYYVLSLVILWDEQLPPVTYAMLIGLVIVLILLTLISLFYKISAHMTAMGGVLGSLAWLGDYYGIWDIHLLFYAILAAGLLASTRLYLQAHKESEIATGLLLGFFVIFGTLSMMIA